MTDPNWNGRGQDPWLPHRLQARLEVAQTERNIRRSFWAELSGWLVGTHRRVLRGDGPPDLDAVWARVPAWREAVEAVVQGEVFKALGLAYTRLLGDTFRWDQRIFTGRYLSQVRNRLVRLPEEVFDLIAQQVNVGVNLGEGIPELRDRVDLMLSTTRSERWPNRATVVARTEAIGALNGGRFDAFNAFAEETGEELERVWLSTDDVRTRDTHVTADGQRASLAAPFTVGGFELMFPGDPSGPPQEVIQCRCTMLLVERGESVDMSNRQFRRRS